LALERNMPHLVLFITEDPPDLQPIASQFDSAVVTEFAPEGLTLPADQFQERILQPAIYNLLLVKRQMAVVN
jgi:hypothetical protein